MFALETLGLGHHIAVLEQRRSLRDPFEKLEEQVSEIVSFCGENLFRAHDTLDINRFEPDELLPPLDLLVRDLKRS